MVLSERMVPVICDGNRLYGNGHPALTMRIAFFPLSCGLGIYRIAFASQYSNSGTFLSKNIFSVPGILPQYTGTPSIRRSARLIFPARICASSRGSTQALSGLHFRHPMHGFMVRSCIRTTSTSCVELIALSASASRLVVIPFLLGLALMINTFMVHSPSVLTSSALLLRFMFLRTVSLFGVFSPR